MQGSTLIITLLFIVGGGCALMHFLLGRSRAYLLYTGIMFAALGVSLMLSREIRWAPLLIALFAAVLAMYEGVQDSKDRMARFREEQRDREEAFGEFMEAMARGGATGNSSTGDE